MVTNVKWLNAAGSYSSGRLPSGTITALTFGDDDTVYAGFSNGELWWTQDIRANNPSWFRVDNNQFLAGANWGGGPVTSLLSANTADGWRLYATIGSTTNNVFSISYNFAFQTFVATNWQIPENVSKRSTSAFYDGGPNNQAVFVGTTSQIYYRLLGSNNAWQVQG